MAVFVGFQQSHCPYAMPVQQDASQGLGFGVKGLGFPTPASLCGSYLERRALEGFFGVLSWLSVAVPLIGRRSISNP